MAVLPDELWRKILEIGVQSSGFTYKDLCCLSISCRRLRRLSDEDPLWNPLLSSDFPPTQTSSANSFLNSSHPCSTSPSSKSLYKIRFEKDKERRIAGHRRAIFRKESHIAEHSRKLRDIENRIIQESTKMRETAAELSNFRKIRFVAGPLPALVNVCVRVVTELKLKNFYRQPTLNFYHISSDMYEGKDLQSF